MVCGLERKSKTGRDWRSPCRSINLGQVINIAFVCLADLNLLIDRSRWRVGRHQRDETRNPRTQKQIAYSTAIVTGFDSKPSMLILTTTSSPLGASSGTRALTW